MSRKKVAIGLAALVLLVAGWMIGSGFTTNNSVYLTDDFSVSEDGSTLTFTVGLASSMGYVRGYTDGGGGAKPHYLRFYAAWGGLNSKLGARDTFTLTLAPEDTEIWFSRGDGGYALVLQKDGDSGQWKRCP